VCSTPAEAVVVEETLRLLQLLAEVLAVVVLAVAQMAIQLQELQTPEAVVAVLVTTSMGIGVAELEALVL